MFDKINKPVIIAAALALIVGVVVFAYLYYVGPPAIERSLRVGIEALEESDFDTAIRAFEIAESLMDEIDEQLLTNLGRAYYGALRFEDAAALFKRAIELFPEANAPYAYAAESLAYLHSVEEALSIAHRGYEVTGDERLAELIEEIGIQAPVSLTGSGRYDGTFEFAFEEVKEGVTTHYEIGGAPATGDSEAYEDPIPLVLGENIIRAVNVNRYGIASEEAVFTISIADSTSNTNGNVVNGAMAAAQGEHIYYSTDHGLYRADRSLGNPEKIIDGLGIGNLGIAGENLYFTGSYSYGRSGIFRTKLDGSGIARISEDLPAMMQIKGNKVFYTTSDGLYSMDLSGEGLEMIVSGAIGSINCYSNSIYYILESEKDSVEYLGDIYCYDIPSGESIRVAGPGFLFMLVENGILYTLKENVDGVAGEPSSKEGYGFYMLDEDGAQIGFKPIGADVSVGIVADMGTGVGAGEVTDMGAVVGMGIGVEMGADIGEDMGVDIGTVEGDMGAGIGVAANDMGVGVGADIDVDIGAAEGDMGAGADIGAEMGTGTGIGADMGTGTGIGADMGTGTGIGAEMGTGTGIGAEMGTGAGIGVAAGAMRAGTMRAGAMRAGAQNAGFPEGVRNNIAGLANEGLPEGGQTGGTLLRAGLADRGFPGNAVQGVGLAGGGLPQWELLSASLAGGLPDNAVQGTGLAGGLPDNADQDTGMDEEGLPGPDLPEGGLADDAALGDGFVVDGLPGGIKDMKFNINNERIYYFSNESGALLAADLHSFRVVEILDSKFLTTDLSIAGNFLICNLDIGSEDGEATGDDIEANGSAGSDNGTETNGSADTGSEGSNGRAGTNGDEGTNGSTGASVSAGTSGAGTSGAGTSGTGTNGSVGTGGTGISGAGAGGTGTDGTVTGGTGASGGAGAGGTGTDSTGVAGSTGTGGSGFSAAAGGVPRENTLGQNGSGVNATSGNEENGEGGAADIAGTAGMVGTAGVDGTADWTSAIDWAGVTTLADWQSEGGRYIGYAGIPLSSAYTMGNDDIIPLPDNRVNNVILTPGGDTYFSVKNRLHNDETEIYRYEGLNRRAELVYEGVPIDESIVFAESDFFMTNNGVEVRQYIDGQALALEDNGLNVLKGISRIREHGGALYFASLAGFFSSDMNMDIVKFICIGGPESNEKFVISNNRVYFIKRENQKGYLYVMGIDGRGIERLFNDAILDFDIDGGNLYYIGADEESIHRVDLSTGEKEQVFAGPADSIVCGRGFVVFRDFNEKFSISIINSDDGNVTGLTESGVEQLCVYARDVYYCDWKSNGRLFKVNVDTLDRVEILY